LEILALLPLLSFVAIFIYLGQVRPAWGWRLSFLRSAVFLGAYGILSLEALTLLDAVTQTTLATTWLLPLMCFSLGLGILWRRDHILRLPAITFPEGGLERLLIIGVVLILAITAIVAWVTPPQTMLGSLVGVSLVAKEFGANRNGQIISVVFAATIPMGIVQASSTLTDYVVALWMVCVAVEILRLRDKGSIVIEVVVMSTAAGLAILTKPIAYAYLLPFALYAAFRLRWEPLS